MSVFIYLSIYLPIYLSTYLSIYLSIYLPIYMRDGPGSLGDNGPMVVSWNVGSPKSSKSSDHLVWKPMVFGDPPF